MSKVCVISIDPTFGNGPSVVNALAEKVDVEAVFQRKDKKGMWKNCKAKYGFECIPTDADLYIVIGGGTLQRVAHRIVGKKVKLIITDTRYRSATIKIDDLIEKLNAEVFCMPDLWHLCKFEKKAFYQPFNISKIKIRKRNPVFLCHSPYSDAKSKRKGTEEIIEVFKKMQDKYGISYRIIKGLQWRKCLKIKARAHIFVDQYIHGEYIGGVGKSGLESMLLKCLTISSGRPVKTDIPDPPVVWCNERLGRVINRYILKKEKRNETIEKQYEWAKKYTSFDFVASRLLS